MKKSYIVDSTCKDMRIDRWIRNYLGKIPQSLIEKNLRAGKIKLNKKKVKSSYKIKTEDRIDLFNINFKENIESEIFHAISNCCDKTKTECYETDYSQSDETNIHAGE